MRQLVLYSTLGCHLCEQAKAVCESVMADIDVQFTELDIADDEALMEAYGVRIPVLRDPSLDVELGWPFGRAELTVWLQSRGKF